MPNAIGAPPPPPISTHNAFVEVIKEEAEEGEQTLGNRVLYAWAWRRDREGRPERPSNAPLA